MLLRAASTVAHPHLQLVPRGLLQVVQDVGLGERGPLSRGPDCGPEGSVLQSEGGDGAAPIVPADQIQPHPGSVDAGKELLLLGELGFCGGTQAVSALGKWVTTPCSGACPWLLSLSSLALAKARSPVIHSKSKTLGTNKFSQP